MSEILMVLSICTFIVTVTIIITSTIKYDRESLHSSILSFIESNQIITNNSITYNAIIYYTRGGCYDFYLLLKEKFPNAIGYYNSDHVITKIGTRYYDITGEVKKYNHLKIDKHFPNTFKDASK